MRYNFFIILFIFICTQASFSQNDANANNLKQQIGDTLNVIANSEIWVGNVAVRNLNINKRTKTLTITTNESLGYLPFREKNVNEIYSAIRSFLPNEYDRYKVYCKVGRNNIEDLIPNYYRSKRNDSKRQFKHKIEVNTPLVKNTSRPNEISKGLEGRHIALWQSHGWHYDQKLARWEWQRARLFQTVEDLYTQSYVLPFLVPMLENAGANVLIPRERDWQINEVIVDNDDENSTSTYLEKNGEFSWERGAEDAFSHPQESYLFKENPFVMGTYRKCPVTSNKEKISFIEWIPNIPESGKYAVYVSYWSLPNSTGKAKYTVHHKGGKTDFEVNQTMYGNTWLYLGHFDFEKGASNKGKVVLNNYTTEKEKIVTADGVKFGGGMGNIARSPLEPYKIKIWRDTTLVIVDSLRILPNINYVLSDITSFSALDSSYYAGIDTSCFRIDSIYTKKGKRSFNPDKIYIKGQTYSDSIIYVQSPLYEPETSGYPRFTEGARYWLQWAGMPDSIYSRSNGANDYTDDFQSRGFWVNYISGGSASSPQKDGLKVPIDLALAFHTDAGTTNCDSIIGTLGICTTRSTDKRYVYNNGVSRLAARDLTDIIQTQIVSDIRFTHEPEWVRRGIWDKSYSESREPEVPTMLLELLSHQNFADMRYGLDPRFRFTVCRAIYKGILKYFESVHEKKYIVQPLPVEQFNIRFINEKEIELNWTPINDPLEPTAKAKQYIVYMQTDNTGFDNGFLLNENRCRFNLEPDKIYNFKVTAVNEGGESFPSESLTVCRTTENKGEVLIINGFDRISAPASFMLDSTYAGFLNRDDAGVPYVADISFIGEQYEFRRDIPWSDDDAPGFGASHGTHETMLVAGNSFNYPYLHGKAIKEAGYSFVSCSKKSVINGTINLDKFKIVDLILGKQKETFCGNGKSAPEFKTFPLDLQQKIEQYCQAGGNLFVSGSNLASDMYHNSDTTENDIVFVENVLKCKLRNAQASVSGNVKVVQSPVGNFEKSKLCFYNEPNPVSYFIESPDAIEPIDANGYTICRYAENNLSAGIVHDSEDNKICALGFPFETIKEESERNKLMRSILNYLSTQSILKEEL